MIQMERLPSLTSILLQAGTQQLAAAGIGPARREAEWLLSRLMAVPPLELYLDERRASEPMAERFFAQIRARASGAPLQYLLGDAEFFGRPFMVEPGVFIPRPETETIVEAFLRAIWQDAGRRTCALQILELGVGSGCIAVTVAQRLPACHLVGVEVSWNALAVARRNVLRYELLAHVHLVQGSWTDGVRGTFDAVISNPPYIPTHQIQMLPLDVRQEPLVSLDGGADGLRDLGALMDSVPRLLRPGGILALECGEDQVDALLRRRGHGSWIQRITRVHDLAGRPRGILLYRK